MWLPLRLERKLSQMPNFFNGNKYGFRIRTDHSYHLYSKFIISHTEQCPCRTVSQTVHWPLWDKKTPQVIGSYWFSPLWVRLWRANSSAQSTHLPTYGGRWSSSDDSFHNITVSPPSALDKPSIMKCYHHWRRTRWGVTACSPMMVTYNASWYLVCWGPMVEWRLDCENCRHLTILGLHDSGPWRPNINSFGAKIPTWASCCGGKPLHCSGQQTISATGLRM